jgi:hypothetical protein
VINASRERILEVLENISAAVGDRSIAKKYVDGIHDSDIRKTIFNVLLRSARDLPNQFSFGDLPIAWQGGQISGASLSSGFSIGFWLRNDASCLTGRSYAVPLVRLIDSKANTLTVALSNNYLITKFVGSTVRTQVIVCNRMTSNIWTHFTIVFPGDRRPDRYLISTFKDGNVLHDSEFDLFSFSGPFKVVIGGKGPDGGTEAVFGRIAQIFISRDRLHVNDISRAMFDNSPITGELFSSMRPPPNETSSPPETEQLRDALSQPALIRKISRSYFDCRDVILLSILELIISKSTDKTLPQKFRAEITEPTKQLYQIFYRLTLQIEDNDTQCVWLEEVLINGNVWGWDKVSVISHWNSVLIWTFRSFFEHKPYFSYFLQHFNELPNEAVLLLTRVGQLRLETADADALFSALTESVTHSEKVLTLLSIVRDLSVKIRRLNYDKPAVVLSLLKHGDVRIVALAIEAFHDLIGPSFYSRIWAIVSHLDERIPRFIPPVESRLSTAPSLFALNCALALFHPAFPLSVFPEALPTSAHWFLFPVLLMVCTNGEQQQRLMNVIARTALQSDASDVAKLRKPHGRLFEARRPSGRGGAARPPGRDVRTRGLGESRPSRDPAESDRSHIPVPIRRGTVHSAAYGTLPAGAERDPSPAQFERRKARNGVLSHRPCDIVQLLEAASRSPEPRLPSPN